jgi:signal transduction histidine kinase
VRVTIADNGSGITAESMTHIFEPFFTTKKDTGTGLGLWLSYSIVQKHGGWIRVRSRANQGHSGTIFSIFLPTAMQPSKAA